MLSILCSTLWGGHTGAFSVGVFIGGLMMQTKHQYKREDVKKDKLEKWYLNYLKTSKYPLIEEQTDLAQKAIDALVNDAPKTTLEDLVFYINGRLKTDLVRGVITADGLRYFTDPAFKNKVNVQQSASLGTVHAAYNNFLDNLVGTIDIAQQDPSTYIYRGATGIYRDADDAVASQRKSATQKLTNINNVGGGKALAEFLTKTLGAGDPAIIALQAQIANPDGSKSLQKLGEEATKAYVNKIVLQNLLARLRGDIEISAEWLDDPLERALKAYQAEQAKAPSADDYNPEGTKTPPLTSPEVCDGPGEQDNWETLKGEDTSKRIGLTYGFSVGYEKEMNNNHTFVGGNAFAKKDSMTIKYDLQVEKGSHANFGNLETQPGYTYGVTVIAGKHLNPVFSVFGRGTFEFTKYDFTYNLANESPKIAKGTMRTQKLGNWVKQAAVGVGARYNFAPLWSAEACYDFVPATKTTVRDFNKLGEDDRRRGYIYTTSQHRVFLKVVRFFNF